MTMEFTYMLLGMTITGVGYFIYNKINRAHTTFVNETNKLNDTLCSIQKSLDKLSSQTKLQTDMAVVKGIIDTFNQTFENVSAIMNSKKNKQSEYVPNPYSMPPFMKKPAVFYPTMPNSEMENNIENNIEIHKEDEIEDLIDDVEKISTTHLIKKTSI